MKATNAKAETITTEAQEEFDQAKKAAMEAYENFLEAKEHLKKAAQNAGIEFKESANEQFHETVDKLNERKRQAVDEASSYIRENPLSSAGIAFVGGMLFARLLGK